MQRRLPFEANGTRVLSNISRESRSPILRPAIIAHQATAIFLIYSAPRSPLLHSNLRDNEFARARPGRLKREGSSRSYRAFVYNRGMHAAVQSLLHLARKYMRTMHTFAERVHVLKLRLYFQLLPAPHQIPGYRRGVSSLFPRCEKIKIGSNEYYLTLNYYRTRRIRWLLSPRAVCESTMHLEERTYRLNARIVQLCARVHTSLSPSIYIYISLPLCEYARMCVPTITSTPVILLVSILSAERRRIVGTCSFLYAIVVPFLMYISQFVAKINIVRSAHRADCIL